MDDQDEAVVLAQIEMAEYNLVQATPPMRIKGLLKALHALEVPENRDEALYKVLTFLSAQISGI